MKKIICVFLVSICLVTVCFATFDETSLKVDSSITLPDSIIQSIQLFSETMNYVVVRCDSSFNYVYYITGMGNATGTVSIGQFVMFTYDSTSVNYSNDGVFTYANIFVYDSDGTQTDSRRYQTGYTVLPSCFTIVQSKGFTFNGEDYVVKDTTIESEEDKEYKSGVLGWFQKLFDSIENGFNSVIDGLDYLFNPNSDKFDTSFGEYVYHEVSSNVPSFNMIISSINNFQNTNKPFVIEFPVKFGTDFFGGKAYTHNFRIDLSFYEKYRSHVRSGIAVIFNVATFLCCFNMIKSIFNLDFGGTAGAGQAFRDDMHNKAENIYYQSMQSRSDSLNSYLDKWGS